MNRSGTSLTLSLAAAVLVACFGSTYSEAQRPAAPQQNSPFPFNERKGPGGAVAASADLDASQASDPVLQAKLDTVMNTIGRGYNSFTNTIVGDCVNGIIYGPNPTSFAPSYSISLIRSYEEYAAEMSVEATLSAGLGSFNAKVHSKFQSSSASNHTTEFLLVRERVVAAPDINLRQPKLTVAFSPDPATQANFYRRCGDQFISRIQMGGELIAVLSFDKSEQQQKKELEADATASGWGASGSVDFNGKMSSLKNESNLQIDSRQLGGKTSTLPDFNLDGLIAYARAFPGQITPATAVPIGVGTPEPYLNLGVDEKDFNDAHQNYDTVTAALAVAATRAEQAKDLEAILKHYTVPATRSANDVVARTEAQLRAAQTDYARLVSVLKTCGTYFWQETSCTFDPRFLNYNPPQPGPVFVLPVVTTQANSPSSVSIPSGMTLELRGTYCWRGNDNCDVNGQWSGDSIGYVKVTAPFLNGPYRGPIGVRPGTVTVQAMDTEYGDNKGELTMIVY